MDPPATIADPARQASLALLEQLYRQFHVEVSASSIEIQGSPRCRRAVGGVTSPDPVSTEMVSTAVVRSARTDPLPVSSSTLDAVTPSRRRSPEPVSILSWRASSEEPVTEPLPVSMSRSPFLRPVMLTSPEPVSSETRPSTCSACTLPEPGVDVQFAASPPGRHISAGGIEPECPIHIGDLHPTNAQIDCGLPARREW